jgi:histidinol dehydrogenase
MRLLSGSEAAAFVANCGNRRAANLDSVEAAVREIVSKVRTNGDKAVRKYAEKWDGLAKGQPLRISAAEIKASLNQVPADFLEALRSAECNIRAFAERQRPREWIEERDGVALGQIVRPIDSVGCYVPGGRFPLPSTLLMTVIPAQVAGVTRIAVASPRPAAETLAAAALLGVSEFYCIGGAQAIAAFAFGTESIPRVDKIVGPGNSFVTCAKKLVAFDCAIDMLAGPTEAVIVSKAGNATLVAADLVAQAEHDVETCCIFVTASPQMAKAVSSEVLRLSADNKIAHASLQNNGALLVASSHDEALRWANSIASEHLTVAEKDLPFVKNAGSIFVGDYSSQVFGDYIAGPNHVLPTGGSARFRGGLSVCDFVKVISVQKVSRAGAGLLAKSANILANAEGLKAHAIAAQLRMEDGDAQSA